MTAVPTLTLDGRPVSARPGETILDLCREHGIPLPTLCHLDGLSDVGACRLCLVEVKGAARLLPACSTYAAEGMEVSTDSAPLRRYRRQLVELLLAEGNHVCAVCTANGACELQSLAASLGVESVRFPYRHPRAALDASHPRFVLDPGRCILCTRCVRVCDELEGAHTWDVAGRGAASHVVTDLAAPWGAGDLVHRVREVRAGVPDRRAPRAGRDPGAGPQGPRPRRRAAPGEGGAVVDPVTRPARRPRLATAWLGGCAGCHMSFLDLDEALLEVLARADLVYGPLVDAKSFPPDVDVTLVEGAVANEDHLALVRTIRASTRLLVALGDCAVTGNVTALRNGLGGAAPVLERVFRDLADPGSSLPREDGILPRLLDRVLPVHQVVPVDVFLPGCPPAPADILAALDAALAGRPAPARALRFG